MAVSPKVAKQMIHPHTKPKRDYRRRLPVAINLERERQRTEKRATQRREVSSQAAENRLRDRAVARQERRGVED